VTNAGGLAVRPGCEPENWLFSSLLIVAFLCGALPIDIRAETNVCKGVVALESKDEQKNPCEVVR
jgi:hypothetical protein